MQYRYGNFFRSTLFSCLTLALAACGGGGSSPVPAAAGPGTNAVISQNGTTITATGTIGSFFSGGFSMQVGAPWGYVHVYTNSSTQITGTLTVGENVLVSGTGSPSTSITASSVGPGPTSSSPTPAALTTSSPAPSPSPGQTISLPAGVTTVGATVSSVSGTTVTVNGGVHYGYFRVSVPSGTPIFGGSLAVGKYVQITGTGTPGYSMTATTISIYGSAPPSNTVVSGVISAGTAYGLTLSANGASIPVPLLSNTVVGGGPLQVGANATVTGIGTSGVSTIAVQVVVQLPTPPPTPTPGPIAQTHVLTEDYLGWLYGTHNIAWTQATPWLTWAQTGTADANAISAAGIKTQLYVDPNRTTPGIGDPLYTSNESTFAHDCSGNRVSYNYNGTLQYVMDVGSSAMQSLFASYANGVTSQAHFDSFFEDDSGALSAYGLTSFTPALPCNYSDSTWLNNELAINQVSPVPVFENSLSGLNGHDVSLTLQVVQNSSNTAGGSFEHCYTDNGAPAMGGWEWQDIENSELSVATMNKTFLCLERNTNPASSSYAQRIYGLASFLLTYNPQSSILWTEFATQTGFHVMPEAAIVPLAPKVATPSSVSGLQVTGGAYGREYSNCYIGGQFVSACAVVVNPDQNFSHTFPYPQYTHTLVLNGSGVLDGGSIATNGPPPPTTLPPLSAEIVFP